MQNQHTHTKKRSHSWCYWPYFWVCLLLLMILISAAAILGSEVKMSNTRYLKPEDANNAKIQISKYQKPWSHSPIRSGVVVDAMALAMGQEYEER